MVTRVLITQFQVDGLDSKSQVDSLRDQILVLMTRLFSEKRMHLSDKNLNTFQRRHLSTVTRVPITQSQVDGLDSRFQVDNLRDQTLASMTRLFSRKRMPLLDKNLNTFQKLHLFTVINLSTTQFQEVGPVNRFQADSLRDQTQALMMTLSLRRKVRFRRTNILQRHQSMSQMLHPSMVINLSTTQFQEVGLVNRFQEDNSRDQTRALMMTLSLRRKERFRRTNILQRHQSMSQKSHPSMVINLSITPYQAVGLESKFQADSLRDQTLASMTKLS